MLYLILVFTENDLYVYLAYLPHLVNCEYIVVSLFCNFLESRYKFLGLKKAKRSLLMNKYFFKISFGNSQD